MSPFTLKNAVVLAILAGRWMIMTSPITIPSLLRSSGVSTAKALGHKAHSIWNPTRLKLARLLRSVLNYHGTMKVSPETGQSLHGALEAL